MIRIKVLQEFTQLDNMKPRKPGELLDLPDIQALALIEKGLAERWPPEQPVVEHK